MTHKIHFLFLPLLFGAWSCSEPVRTCEPAEEECNNEDDDCDGRIDEAESGGPLRQPCSTACGQGEEECNEGQWGNCTAEQPLEEQCNGADDDCDGRVDETCECVHGQTRQCGTDVGECDFGAETCTNGEWGECQMAYDPEDHPEECDGLDNNCDGNTDEGCRCEPNQTQPCGSDVGTCEKGEQTCDAEGQWGAECVGEVLPVTDICDGLDNNCDGEPDYWVSVDFGWETDLHENNNTCDAAGPLLNSEHEAIAYEGTPDEVEWVSIDVADAADLNTYPTLLAGDEDWYHVLAKEVSSGCVPGFSQCTFVFVAELVLLDRTYVEGAVQEPGDYEMCIAFQECPTMASPIDNCTRGTNWDDERSSYLMAFEWRGVCLGNDDREVKIQVHSPDGTACGHYQLYAAFYFDSERDCPP